MRQTPANHNRDYRRMISTSSPSTHTHMVTSPTPASDQLISILTLPLVVYTQSSSEPCTRMTSLFKGRMWRETLTYIALFTQTLSGTTSLTHSLEFSISSVIAEGPLHLETSAPMVLQSALSVLSQPKHPFFTRCHVFILPSDRDSKDGSSCL